MKKYKRYSLCLMVSLIIAGTSFWLGRVSVKLYPDNVSVQEETVPAPLPHEPSGAVSEKSETALSSLGVGWITRLWEDDVDSSTDKASASSPVHQAEELPDLLSKETEVCIPNYTKAVPWEKNDRYMVSDSGCGTRMFRSTVQEGDSAGALLRHWMDSNDAEMAIRSAEEDYPLSRIRVGQLFSVEQSTEDERVNTVFYDIDEESCLVIEREEDGFRSYVQIHEMDTRLEKVQGTIDSSLFETMADIGESANLAVKLASVFEHQINFVNEIQEGDTFEFLVEKKYMDEEFRRYGRIIAARFVNAGKTYEAYLFNDGKGHFRYFDEDGASLQTSFLKAPLDFTRISSGYTHKRMHPVFHKVRPHLGVDYAAPTGTPVKSLGDGIVTFRGWQRGYGNTVIIRHANGVETQYAHLSRFAKSLKKGSKVDKGQVVAYVGATGTATGPHLDFRVKKNGKFVNPSTLSGTRTQPVPQTLKAEFKNTVDEARAFLNGHKSLAEYECSEKVEKNEESSPKKG